MSMWERRSLQQRLGSDNYVVKNAEPRNRLVCLRSTLHCAFGVLAMAAKSENSQEM